MGIATPADFQAGQEAVITLPESGLDVRARRVSLTGLILDGGIPDPLAAAALRVISRDTVTPETEEERRRSLAEQRDVVNQVACAMILDPPTTLDGRDGTLDVNLIPEQDRMELWAVATGTVGRWHALRRFPGGATGIGTDVASGREGVRDQAEPGHGLGGDASVGLGGPVL